MNVIKEEQSKSPNVIDNITDHIENVVEQIDPSKEKEENEFII